MPVSVRPGCAACWRLRCSSICSASSAMRSRKPGVRPVSSSGGRGRFRSSGICYIEDGLPMCHLAPKPRRHARRLTARRRESHRRSRWRSACCRERCSHQETERSGAWRFLRWRCSGAGQRALDEVLTVVCRKSTNCRDRKPDCSGRARVLRVPEAFDKYRGIECEPAQRLSQTGQ